MRSKRAILLIALVVAVALAATAAALIWALSRPTMFDSPRLSVMSTEVQLKGVAPRWHRDRVEAAFDEAEAALRTVEATMSRWIDRSEISRLNAAPAGQEVKLSPATLTVLRTSRQVWVDSEKVFDVTIFPLIKLWAEAGETDTLPTDEQLAAARAASSWEQIELTETGARKLTATASVDLGGIAKGYAIDVAAEALLEAGLDGGLVNVGGDIRCFGEKPDGGPWRVGIAGPFDPDNQPEWAILEVRDRAVCTSGNYRRFSTIRGERYSHIFDPRTGRPAGASPSVTVVAPTAIVADAWATALSVLGPKGRALLPEGVEAMIVTGGPDNYRVHTTAGFEKFVSQWPPRAKK